MAECFRRVEWLRFREGTGEERPEVGPRAGTARTPTRRLSALSAKSGRAALARSDRWRVGVVPLVDQQGRDRDDVFAFDNQTLGAGGQDVDIGHADQDRHDQPGTPSSTSSHLSSTSSACVC
jgi:hypothetical protein